MNRRERKEAEAKAIAEAPVPTEMIEYWANYEVGGSGMSIGTQQMLKSMAIEILKARNK